MVNEQNTAPDEVLAEADAAQQQTNAEGLSEEVPAEETEKARDEDIFRLLEDARAKADEHWDQLLRVKAEMDNVNKRHDRELQNAHRYALDNFVKELLQIWDSLELGHSAAQEESADVAKLREGTELTLKLFGDVMNKFGVEQLDPIGQAFDPEYHQAMSMQSRDDIHPNHVANVVQKGCLLNGRLVRPALVIVSRASD